MTRKAKAKSTRRKRKSIEVVWSDGSKTTESAVIVHGFAICHHPFPSVYEGDWTIATQSGCAFMFDYSYDAAVESAKQLATITIGGVPLAMLPACELLTAAPVIRHELGRLFNGFGGLTRESNLIARAHRMSDALACAKEEAQP